MSKFTDTRENNVLSIYGRSNKYNDVRIFIDSLQMCKLKTKISYETPSNNIVNVSNIG